MICLCQDGDMFVSCLYVPCLVLLMLFCVFVVCLLTLRLFLMIFDFMFSHPLGISNRYFQLSELRELKRRKKAGFKVNATIVKDQSGEDTIVSPFSFAFLIFQYIQSSNFS